MEAYKLGTPLNIQWHFKKPDGSAFSLEGLSVTLKYRTGRGMSPAQSVMLAGETGDIISWAFNPGDQKFTGVYDLYLDMYEPSNQGGWKKLCRAVYQGAFALEKDSPYTKQCGCKAAPYSILGSAVETEAASTRKDGVLIPDDKEPGYEIDGVVPTRIVSLFSTAEWWLYTPVTPLISEDGYWVINGDKSNVPVNYNLTWDESDKALVISYGEGSTYVELPRIYAIRQALNSYGNTFDSFLTEKDNDFERFLTAKQGDFKDLTDAINAAFTQWQEAENAREYNEGERQHNEENRQSAEALRQSAFEESQQTRANAFDRAEGLRDIVFNTKEQQREQKVDEAVSQADAAAARAEAEADSAYDAANDCLDAGSMAVEAAQRADQTIARVTEVYGIQDGNAVINSEKFDISATETDYDSKSFTDVNDGKTLYQRLEQIDQNGEKLSELEGRTDIINLSLKSQTQEQEITTTGWVDYIFKLAKGVKYTITNNTSGAISLRGKEPTKTTIIDNVLPGETMEFELESEYTKFYGYCVKADGKIVIKSQDGITERLDSTERETEELSLLVQNKQSVIVNVTQGKNRLHPKVYATTLHSPLADYNDNNLLQGDGWGRMVADVEGGKTYTANTAAGSFAFYDIKGNIIETIPTSAWTTPYTFTTPDKCVKMSLRAFVASGKSNVVQIEEGNEATAYEPYVEPKYTCSSTDLHDNVCFKPDVEDEDFKEALANVSPSKWKGKRLLAIGDSITANVNSWQYPTAEILGMNVRTHAKGGISIIQMVDGDGSGDRPSSSDPDTDASGNLYALSSADVADVDIIVLMGFYNERGKVASAKGNATDMYPSNDTFEGRLNYAIKRVYECLASANNYSCRVVICSAHKYGKYGWNDNTAYEDGDLLLSATKEVADYNSLPCIDLMHNGNINKYNWNVYQAESLPINPSYLPSDGINDGTNKPFASLSDAPSPSSARSKWITVEGVNGCYNSDGTSWVKKSNPCIWNSDQLHLNESGHKRIAEYIASYLNNL